MPHNVVAGHNWKRAALIVLVLVGAWLRFYALDRYPLGVHWDELSNIYDGYSIAETGADRFGSPHPAIVRAFGENDYRPALYAWLAAGSIKVFGFSVEAGRIPAAVLGTASLILLYLFASSLAGTEFGLLALLLGVLSPLHIQYSRVAHEGAILPGFFVILILYLWQQASIRKFSLPIVAFLGLAIGLSANSYQATKLTAVLFAVGAATSIFRHGRARVPALLTLAAGALIGASPQIMVMLADPTHFFSRARVLAIRTDSPLGYPVLIAHNYWLNLAPHYLFVPRKYEALSVARLLPPEFLFFYAGLIGMAKLPTRPPSWEKWQLYFALVVVILPAAVSMQSPHPLRTSGMTVLTPLFSAAGIVWLYSLIPTRISIRRFYYPMVVLALVASSALIIYRYSTSEMFRSLGFQNFLTHLDTRLGRYADRFDAVIVENYGSQRYMYVAAYAGMTPQEFQSAPKILYSDGMDNFMRLGKYYFVKPSVMQATVDSLAPKTRILFVAKERLRGVQAIDSVTWRDEKAYLMTRD